MSNTITPTPGDIGRPDFDTNFDFADDPQAPPVIIGNQRQIRLNYQPRWPQAEMHRLKHRHRFFMPICHRRMGKTVWWIMHAIDAACRNQREDPPPRYSYVAPYRDQAKRIAWEYLKRLTRELPGYKPMETELTVQWMGNGQGSPRAIGLYGADNFNSLRGNYNDGVGLDEYGQMPPEVLEEVMLPTLADFDGWLAIMGTPAGRNHMHRLKTEIEDGKRGEAWRTITFKASETGILKPATLELMKQSQGIDKYEQEYECSFDAAIRGAYYADELRQMRGEGRLVKHIPVERMPAGFAFDLGIGDDTAIWVFQLIGREVRILAYYASNGVGLDHYVGWLERWRVKHHVPFFMPNNQIFPADVNVRELSNGKSRIQTLRGMGLQPRALPILKVDEGINAVRQLLPRCWIDEVACRSGVDALSSYRREWDEKKQSFNDRPLHDWACFVPETCVLTRHGTYRIVDLPETGEVLTPCGWKQYRNVGVTGHNAPLVEVTFSDASTVQCTPEHMFLTVNGWRSAESLLPGTLIQSSLTRSRSISMAVCTAYGQVSGICRAVVNAFTGKYGRALSDRSRQVIMSTTRMMTPGTMSPITCFACPHGSICASHVPTTHAAQVTQPRTGHVNGTSQKKVGYGTAVTCSASSFGRPGSALRSLANTAVRLFKQLCEKVGTGKSSVPKLAKPKRIACVRQLPQRRDVWCLTVDDGHWFTLANGAVVHNSHGADAFRYLAMGLSHGSGTRGRGKIEYDNRGII